MQRFFDTATADELTQWEAIAAANPSGQLDE
jgi:hypothetical protein